MSSRLEREFRDQSRGEKSLRAVFMGTPSFAVPVLDALHECREVEVAAVYTPPDRKRGRGQTLGACPVKARGEELGIPVVQPGTFRNAEAVSELESYRPDVIVVAAYGRLLPVDVLAIPRLGCLNLHPSLLPKHRGPAPVAGAILAGDAVTGVSVMLLDEGMDTGPIVAQWERGVDEWDDAATLTETLFADGAALLIETLPGWAEGSVSAKAQDHERATYTSKLERADGLADWGLSAEILARRQRGYTPWPGLYTTWEGSELKLLEVAAVSGVNAEPGRVSSTSDYEVAVGTGDGLLAVRRLQLEGRRPSSGEDFLRGYPEFPGSMLV